MALVDTADTLEETIEEKELALERIDELEAQLEDESGRVNELSAALRASDKTAKDLEQEIGGLEAKGEGLAAEVARYREELDAQAHQLAVSPGREVVPPGKRGGGRGGGSGPGSRPVGFTAGAPEGGGREGDAVDAREGLRQGLSLCLMGNLWLPRFPTAFKPSSLEGRPRNSSWRSEPEDRRGGSWSWSTVVAISPAEPAVEGNLRFEPRRGGPGAQEGVCQEPPRPPPSVSRFP